MASLAVVFISTLTFVLSTMEDAKVNQEGEEANSGLLLVIEITGAGIDEMIVLLNWLEYSPRPPVCRHLHSGVRSEVPLLPSEETVRPPAYEPQ